jgi:nucleotide-binding universal stress UspA family protein
MVVTDQDTENEPILVAVDFSAHSAAALLWAAELASRLDVPLLVLHVVHDPGAAPGYYTAVERGGELRRMEERAAEMLQAFLAQQREEHPQLDGVKELVSSLVVGLPASRILEVAEKTNARLIVMGSQGRTGLAHALLGSKAERVVQLSPIPVTIVKAPGA